jgi:hypothetical protein
MNNKQKEILQYLLTVDEANLEDIYNKVSFSYYYNWKKHLGSILSTMVKNGNVIRVKRGVFKINEAQTKAVKQSVNPNQTTLF